MNTIVYLLQVSACTAIFYLFYRLLLSRLTFFVINRWYLLATLLLSFIIPLITIPVNLQQEHIAVVQQVVYAKTLQTVPFDMHRTQTIIAANKPTDWILLLKIIYFLAVIALAVHLVVTLIIFFKNLKGKQLTKVGRVNILRSIDKPINGSFFNYIFLHDQELSAKEMQQIVAHEMLHIKLYHSIDRMLVKVAQIILWFNPFIYFYAKSIEENHEFEVDCAMANTTDKKMYADLLLHLSVANQSMLYHSFSKIPLKKRITMLFNQPSAKMKKVIYVLILPVVLISCLAFAKLKSNRLENKFSAIKGVDKLGTNPLIVIDGKVYPKDVLYKIGPSCIKSSIIINPTSRIKKLGKPIKDGYVEIETNKNKITYLTTFEKENLIKESNIPKGQFYTRLRIHDLERGGYIDKIIVQEKSAGISADLGVNKKAGFLINNKLYTEQQAKILFPLFTKLFSVNRGVGPAGLKRFRGFDVKGFDIIFYWDSLKDADTTKYRQKLKRSPEEIKGEADFKSWRETDDFKQKEKLAKDISGKTITVKVKEIIDKEVKKSSDIFDTENGRLKGFLVVYNNKTYFLQTNYRQQKQQKQLNTVLRTGDEITLKVYLSLFGRDSLVKILPANIYKENVKIFQSAEVDKTPDYAFLYESNKVRFADGQITHIQKYQNGKWKSAVLEIVNGYKLNLNFKPTAPDFNSIKENDHVVFRFVHEVKTGAKTYQISDWVSITNNIKDYGIKNPDFFYKFYESTVAKNNDKESAFKVTKLTYQASENVLVPLKKDQANSYISVGKMVSVSTFKKEQERVFKFLSAMFPRVEKSNIIFNIDTTKQKGFCSVETVVKPLT